MDLQHVVVVLLSLKFEHIFFTEENTDDLDIDPNLPDNVIALLKEEEKELQKVVVKVEVNKKIYFVLLP